jgi:hypothetical protein
MLGKRRKEEAMEKENTWRYKDLQITEGLKPGSKHLQYFFVVSEGAEKKCNYCVWMDDEALSSYAPSKNFEEIVSLKREEWSTWVKEKIDEEDYRNLALKMEKTGQKEINLSELKEKITFE